MESYKKRFISINHGLTAYGVRSSSQSERCICRVHEHLREVNEKAYVPEVVGIGPYHCGEGSLEWMEKQKFVYLDSLLQEPKESSLKRYTDSILDLMPELLEFYDDQMNEEQLVEMFVLDGCFIIELVRKFNQPELRKQNDPIFKMDWVFSSLQRDLMLFENQIPFRVLCKLFDLIELPNRHDRLIYFLFKFFCGLFPGPVYGQRINEISASKIKHLLELVHVMWLPSLQVVSLLLSSSSPPPPPSLSPSPRRENTRLRFHSATDLLENGVRFKRLEKASQFKIKFSRGSGVLWVPPITIEERTESFLRNLIAYEQYCDTENLVTAYIKFLDFLIDSPEDVEVLSKYGVIENWLGDSHQVHQMFKKINNFVTIRNVTYPYGELYERVNAYCSTSFRGRIARMRRSLFGGSLAVVWFTLVFTLLFSVLITTTMQTVYTARSDQAG